ncbi:TlpA family protein disulfide reductase [Paenibacillus antri]|uniref:TlpA family protein disulfide reductase n=1 Tax=Paenibacillus antri TaxID=2582848 RepID=A0A5R9G9F7_9BACL|nr:TlpA disulfide reductase family protein [Paenibacillus antri]TLS50018.1 TlpA family protein disulfide reductase [Paenibacillus antri]
MRKNIIILTFVLILAGVAMFQSGKASNQEQLPKIGFQAPGFQLSDLNGESYFFDNIRGNKPVVVNFWASWCNPCRIEAPELVKLYKEYGEEIEILAVNLTEGDSAEAAAEFAEEYGFTFPVLLDKEGTVSDLFQTRAVPTTYFINKDGTIQDIVIGLASPSDLQSKFRQLLP